MGEPATVEIRPTRPGDLPFVTGAEADPDTAPYIQRWSVARHRAALMDPTIGHRVVIDGESGERVGFVVLRGLDRPERLELMRLVITRKGHGYGRAALRAAVAEALHTLGASRVWLDVLPHNERARSLYESEGFTRIGRSEGEEALLIYELDPAASRRPPAAPPPKA